MTTEIAVLNRLGVALATDSAVTISGSGRTKVFDTADKLFELSPKFPVAVMINGNMDCLGVPWEVLIKDFRDAKGDLARASVSEWTDDFLKFVEAHAALNDNAAIRHIRQIADAEISRIQAAVTDILDKLAYGGDGPTTRNFDTRLLGALIHDAAKKRRLMFEELGTAESHTDLAPSDVEAIHGKMFADRLAARFDPYRLAPAELGELSAMLAVALVASMPSELSTGIVIAGYGERETFPSLCTVDVDGRILDRLKIFRRQSHAIDDADDSGRIVSFAQTDVIERLLGGADDEFVRATARFVENAVRKTCTILNEQFRPKRLSRKEARLRSGVLDEAAKAASSEYTEDAARRLRRQSTEEIERMIALMPKQELIELAEALVSITVVERKASQDAGTVGGPIDVALVTKNDGFVWIQRKHYFDKDLNPRYFWRKYGQI